MKYTLKNKDIELTDEEVKEIIKQNSTPKKEKVVGIAIRNRFTGSIIFQSTKTTYKEAVIERLSSGANLRDANLSDADLIGANLIGANLSDADLIGANLSDANLSGANLIDANLIGANLSGANLISANLSGANLSGANLSDANLIGANLRDADLIGANLRNTELNCAKFYGRGGTKPLKKSQLSAFLGALGFIIED